MVGMEVCEQVHPDRPPDNLLAVAVGGGWFRFPSTRLQWQHGWEGAELPA